MAATLQSLVSSSPASPSTKLQGNPNSAFSLSNPSKLSPKSLSLRVASANLASARVHRSAVSTFHGRSLPPPLTLSLPLSRRRRCRTAMAEAAKIQFIQGTDEQTVPEVRLTKSRDGSNGMAIFKFDAPSVFDSSAEVGDITGLYMIDEEGVIQSVDVNAKFVNGKPAGIEAKYVMRTPREWDRFMRFMERYSIANGLQFVKK